MGDKFSFQRFTAGWTLLLAAWLVGGLPPDAAQGQQGSFHAYRLQHIEAPAAARQLAEMLDLKPGDGRVVADASSKQVLVQGDAATQQLAAELIEKLDRPAPAAPVPAAPAAEQATIRGYACPTEQLDRRAELLRGRFPDPSIRITIDRRTGQVLVLAPPQVHAQIATFLSSPAAPVQNTRQPAVLPNNTVMPAAMQQNSPAGQIITRRLPPLQTMSWRQMVERVESLCLAPPKVIAPTDSPTVDILLPGDASNPVRLQVNRSNGKMSLSGPLPAVYGWTRILTILDHPGATADQISQMLPVPNSDPSQIRQAVATLDRTLFNTSSGRDGNQVTAVRQYAGQPARPRWAGDLVSMMFQPQPAEGETDRVEPLENEMADQPTDPFADDTPAAPPGEGTETLPPAESTDPGLNVENPLRDPNAPAGPETAQPPAPGETVPGETTPDETAPGTEAGGPSPLQDDGQLIGPVQIEFIEGLDIIVVRGNKRDVERVLRIINEIERLSVDTRPRIQVLPLKYVESEPMQQLVENLYQQILSPRQGPVSITALVKPNALLLIGREESVAVVVDLVKRLDRPVPPEGEFHVFQLKYVSSEDAAEMITQFYEGRGGLGARINVISDYRSNALVVQAAPRDMAELAKLIEQIDVADSPSENEVKVFKLQNSLAEEMAEVLREALTGEGAQGRSRTTGGQGATGGGQNREGTTMRSALLTMTTIDSQNGGQKYRSAIMSDVSVSADARTNSLLVTAPAESMPLISELIRQLDQLPTEEAQIKVFTIVNGDAVALAEMLTELFGQTTTGNNANQLAMQTAVSEGESSLVPLRFSVDERTNSIIASGAGSELDVVEALLLRLDSNDVRQRQNAVYRLRNSPAENVATAVNEFLRSQRQVEQIAPSAVSPFEQIEREVIVVPEPVTNSLIISATPRYFEDVIKLVEKLDDRPPMVSIQVLIAEVALGEIDELGVELGLQDSLLFDRSKVVDGDLVPGFNFNNQPLGNSADPASLATAANVAGQALSSFATGRTNGELGYGGMVLSASSQSVSILIRALQDDRRLDVLSRPQVMTLDNQSAYVQVGSQVPRVTSTQQTINGTVNSIDLDDVGIILGVTPRISPDGMVVMEIDATKSELGPIDEGIPISINNNGDVIRSPEIRTTRALTTVSARDGQTVVLGGLITENESTIHRKVPWVSDIPIVGQLFRYDKVDKTRTELLIIMTPFIVRDTADVEATKQIESSRMNWCLADVVRIHGDMGLSSADPRDNLDMHVIYPDEQPTVPADEAPVQNYELIPAPTPEYQTEGADQALRSYRREDPIGEGTRQFRALPPVARPSQPIDQPMVQPIGQPIDQPAMPELGSPMPTSVPETLPEPGQLSRLRPAAAPYPTTRQVDYGIQPARFETRPADRPVRLPLP